MTENGWPPDTNRVVAISPNDCENALIPGTPHRMLFQKGIPAIILPAFMADLNQYVESMNNSRGYTDEGSWTNGNSVRSSNHNGATAFDYNWTDHPMGIALDGWHGSDIIHGEEEPEIRRILQFYTWEGVQMVWWANDWDSPKDSMHFQMGYGTYEDQLKCWRFINARIRSDGFSTYRRGGQGRGGGVVVPPEVPHRDLVPLVADAMGNVPGVDYAALTPYVQKCLRMSGCDNNNRIAMWFAQIGHESVGLKYMKEIWGPTDQQLTYQGRMGNNNPGDGERYMGRGPIQVTGKNNYQELSWWAHGEGLVDSPSYFVDHPTQLEKYEYAFLGAVWYWTVARPDINDLCDRGDVVTVTHRINGGETGLQDRTNRWNHCRSIDLTPLIGDEDDMFTDDDRAMLRELRDEYNKEKKSPSRSFMATDGNPVDSPLGYLWNTDANVWNQELTWAYLFGVDFAEKVVKSIAEDGVVPETWAAKQLDSKGRAWLAEFGQQYCQGLIAFKTSVQAAIRNSRPEKA